MTVTWTEFNGMAFEEAQRTDAMANPKDYETQFTGEVIDKYHTFWGTPKFIVALENGSLVSVPMTKCRIVKDGSKETGS